MSQYVRGLVVVTCTIFINYRDVQKGLTFTDHLTLNNLSTFAASVPVGDKGFVGITLLGVGVVLDVGDVVGIVGGWKVVGSCCWGWDRIGGAADGERDGQVSSQRMAGRSGYITFHSFT